MYKRLGTSIAITPVRTTTQSTAIQTIPHMLGSAAWQGQIVGILLHRPLESRYFLKPRTAGITQSEGIGMINDLRLLRTWVHSFVPCGGFSASISIPNFSLSRCTHACPDMGGALIEIHSMSTKVRSAIRGCDFRELHAPHIHAESLFQFNLQETAGVLYVG